jgi:hypothetical protein
MLLGAREEPDDGLADGRRRRAILVRICVGSYHLGQQVRREIGWRTDATRGCGRELQIVNTGDVPQTQTMLPGFSRMAGRRELSRGHLLPALLRRLRMGTDGEQQAERGQLEAPPPPLAEGGQGEGVSGRSYSPLPRSHRGTGRP